tara:strand:- start:398 stop:640 length:243 start_codon:yes stop_codon:yes gene_type:complete
MQNKIKLFDYNDIVETVSEIVNNDKICKDGLTLNYVISNHNHKKLDETLYYKMNPKGTDYKYTDIIEIEVGGITVIITHD